MHLTQRGLQRAGGADPENQGDVRQRTRAQAPANGQVHAVPQAPRLPPWWYLGFWVWRRVVVECERFEPDGVVLG